MTSRECRVCGRRTYSADTSGGAWRCATCGRPIADPHTKRERRRRAYVKAGALGIRLGIIASAAIMTTVFISLAVKELSAGEGISGGVLIFAVIGLATYAGYSIRDIIKWLSQ